MTVECECGRPTSGSVLCERCAARLDYAVSNVGAYYADAHPRDHRQIGGGARAREVDGRLVGGVATMPATQARWDAWATVVAWTRTHMQALQPLTGPQCRWPCLHVSCAEIRRRMWPSSSVPSMCRYLARQHRWTIGQVWAPNMLDEIEDVERRLQWLVDIPAPKWFAGRCGATDLETQIIVDAPECTAELYATTEQGVIECPACSTEYDVSTRRDYLLEQAADHLVTASDAASALVAWTDYDGSPDKLLKRISAWHDEGRLLPRGSTLRNGRDRNTYRLGDVQELLISHIRHMSRRVQSRARARVTVNGS